MNFLTANIALEVDIKRLESQLAKARATTKKAASSMERAFTKMSRVADRAFAKIVRAAKYAAAAILAVGIASVKMAADVEDSEDFFVMSMKGMTDSTRKWSKELADSLYLNQYEIRETVAIFNEMTTAMGMNRKAAAALSQRYTELAYDLVSFHPKVKSLEQASITLQAALTGERETLKRLGYYYSENEVKLEAIRLGYGKNLLTLTALQKLEINDIILMKKMNNVHGDLRRTLESSQNVFRAVWTQVKLLGIAFGEELRPAITETAVTIRDWIKKSKTEIIDWTKIWIEKIEAIVTWFWEWRKAIVAVTVALGGLVIISKITTLVLGLKAAVWGLAAAFGALAAATMYWNSVLLGFVALSGSWKVGILSFLGLMKIKLAAVGISLAGIGVAMAAVFTGYEIYRLISATREYLSVLKSVEKHEKKLLLVVEKTAQKRWEAKMQGFKDMWPEVEPWPEDMRDPSKIIPTEAMENYERMMDALRFEHDMLGKINDVRERAEAMARIKAELQKEENLTAEGLNEKLAAYMALLDRVQAKQASFSHTIRLWINDSIEWGKNLGDVLTDSFDRASDTLADFVVKGKADFAALADSIIMDLTRMIIKAQIAQMIGAFMPGLFGTGAAGAGTGAGTGAAPSPVPSAQHGGEVMKTGLAVIHKGEKYSGVEGEQGSTVNINVNAIDAAGTYQFLNANKRTIANMLQGTRTSNHPLWRK